jgi:carbon storage regulator
MLVLSRKTGEKIVIGHDIIVTVLEARGDTIKIGIQAPKQISVHREEVYHDITVANQQAKASQLPQLNTALRQAGKLAVKQAETRHTP